MPTSTYVQKHRKARFLSNLITDSVKILILGRRIRGKNVLQNQQFVESLLGENGTILQPAASSKLGCE